MVQGEVDCDTASASGSRMQEIFADTTPGHETIDFAMQLIKLMRKAH